MTEASSAGAGGGLRILRIFSRLNIGGPSLHVILLSSGLRPLGYETRLVVGRESPREGNMLPLADEKDVVCESMVGLGREIAPLSDLRALAGLHRLMRTWQPAIVHTHTAKAGVLGRIERRAFLPGLSLKIILGFEIGVDVQLFDESHGAFCCVVVCHV